MEDLLLKIFPDVYGHDVPAEEKQMAEELNCALAYGEILPKSVTKIFDSDRLDAKHATTIYDLGMGLGKLCIQAFLEFPNVTKVVGIEFSNSRFSKGCTALKSLEKIHSELNLNPWNDYTWVLEEETKNKKMKLMLTNENFQSQRILEFQNGNLFHCQDYSEIDIVICETSIKETKYADLCLLLNKMKTGCKILTYQSLPTIYEITKIENPWVSLEAACKDYFQTTWCHTTKFYFGVKKS